MVNSQAENQAIAARLSQTTWIGLYRDPKDKNRWLWLDGSRPSYTNWDKGQPEAHERCVAIYRYGLWHDWTCNAGNVPSFVCETIGKYIHALQFFSVLYICTYTSLRIENLCVFLYWWSITNGAIPLAVSSCAILIPDFIALSALSHARVVYSLQYDRAEYYTDLCFYHHTWQYLMLSTSPVHQWLGHPISVQSVMDSIQSGSQFFIRHFPVTNWIGFQ